MLLAACSSEDPNLPQVHLDFARPDFYDAPFPNVDLFTADGTPDLSGFPNPDGVALVDQGIAMLEHDAHGAALAGGVFFTLSAPLPDAAIPTMRDTLDSSALTQLVALDTGERIPLRVQFEPTGGPFGTANMLALLPLQGTPMRPRTTYAAVLRKDVDGVPTLRASATLDAIRRGHRPAGVSDRVFTAYRDAFHALRGDGVRPRDIAGLAVFTTDDPAAGLYDKVASSPDPVPPTTFTAAESFDHYCVFDATMTFSDYQVGEPPYATEGGEWSDTVQREATSRVVVTVPKTPMPPAGYPLAMFIRAGAGGDRPLVQRGVEDANGDLLVPGTGPADDFARVGYAGFQVDGPIGGVRVPPGTNESYLLYNFYNPVALRDNLRESALELAVLPRVLGSLQVPDCNGGTAHFDMDHLVLVGHSNGASIAILTVAATPAYEAVIVGGAGASFIENVEYKLLPVPALPLAEQLTEDPTISEFDPLLTLVQWAEEPGEDLAYARDVLPTHTLVLQGVVDHYNPPPIANALDLAIPVDLAGPALDETDPDAITYAQPLAPLLPLVGRSHLAYPVQGNVYGTTAVVTQFPGDGVQDPHETMFQTEPPKTQYRCFLATLLHGTPVVIDPATGTCPTP